MKKKSVTIEDLALMVQQGFNHVDKQFDHVDQQFKLVHHELKAIRKELDRVVYRREFEKLEDRVRELENMFAMPRKKAA